MTKLREDIRNIAIIAHVDHGKTTLVDELLKQSETTISERHIQPTDSILLKFVDNSFTLCYNVVVTTDTTIFCMFSLLTGGLLI